MVVREVKKNCLNPAAQPARSGGKDGEKKRRKRNGEEKRFQWRRRPYTSLEPLLAAESRISGSLCFRLVIDLLS